MEQQTSMTLVRNLVSLVKGESYEGYDENAPLELDSINRISLISEIENELDQEIDFDAFSPEIFSSLANLCKFIEEIR
ncbi:hypothetical protein JCM14076_18210 [Methylosoma difficile]